MLSGLVSSVHFVGRPEVPKGPASSKTEEDLLGPSGAPAGPDAPGPSCIGTLLKQGGVDLDQTLPGPDPVEVAAVIISDDNTDFPFEMPQAVSTPKVEPAWGQK